MKPIHLPLAGLAICGVAILAGCVSSPAPLLDNSDIIADSSLTGHYAFSGFLTKKQAVPYDVYLKGNKYVIAAPSPSKAFMVGTLHPFRDHTYIAQLRENGKDRYSYALVRKSSSGIELNWIYCSGECEVSDKAHLRRLADAADAKFDDVQHMAGVRTGNAE